MAGTDPLRRGPAASTLVVAAALLAGCASHTAPAGWLPEPQEVGATPRGGWIDVTLAAPASPARAAGELLAATDDSLWVLTADGARTVAASDIVSGQLVAYDPKVGEVALGTVLGVVSTLSNGFVLLFTAPAWIVVGSIAAGSQSRVSLVKDPPEWSSLAPWARFPQGLPTDLDRTSLSAVPGGHGRP